MMGQAGNAGQGALGANQAMYDNAMQQQAQYGNMLGGLGGMVGGMIPGLNLGQLWNGMQGGVPKFDFGSNNIRTGGTMTTRPW